MAYYSKHTGTAIDDGIDINTSQNTRLTTLETNYNSLNTYAHNLLVDNSIKTSYIQNKAVTADKLADDVKDSLSSIKTYYGTLRANAWIDDLSSSEDYASYANQWKIEGFNERTVDSNIRNTLISVAPNNAGYMPDANISISINIANNYTARCTTYIYCDNAINFAC